jgi:catechol 2,3-dioxygenase
MSFQAKHLGHVNIYVRNEVGLNHMAWMMQGLDDLRELYQRLKDRGIAISSVSDHGISSGIYFSDLDGNRIEVSYELPPSEWPRKEQIFTRDILMLGRFPGPWDADAVCRARTGA